MTHQRDDAPVVDAESPAWVWTVGNVHIIMLHTVAALASERATMLVADAGGEIVGICSVYLDIESIRFGQRAWVEDLAVHPDFRSQRVGKRLLDAAKEWGRGRGASHLELDSAETRPDAHRFYEREGAAYRSISFGWPL